MECGSEGASCNASVATFLSGTVVQQVMYGSGYDDDNSGYGDSSYGNYSYDFDNSDVGLKIQLDG